MCTDIEIRDAATVANLQISTIFFSFNFRFYKFISRSASEFIAIHKRMYNVHAAVR